MQLRAVTDEERQAVKRLAHARTAPARAVERARGVLAALEEQTVEDIAADLRRARTTVDVWRHRFEERGVAGVADRGRSGRPRPYPGEPVGAIVATVLTAPKTVGLPVASWTLDRLVASLAEQQGIPLQRSRLDAGLLSAGLLSAGLLSAGLLSAGAKRRRGSARGSMRTSRPKGGHRAARHSSASGPARELSRRAGA
jgi:transposase